MDKEIVQEVFDRITKEAIEKNVLVDPIREEFYIKFQDKSVEDHKIYPIAINALKGFSLFAWDEVRNDRQKHIDNLIYTYKTLINFYDSLEASYKATLDDRMSYLEANKEHIELDEEKDWKIRNLNRFYMVAIDLLDESLHELREQKNIEKYEAWKDFGDFLEYAFSKGKIYGGIGIIWGAEIDQEWRSNKIN